jgi:hypothetical protein
MPTPAKILATTFGLSLATLLTACGQPAPTYSSTAVAQNQEYVEHAAKMATADALKNTPLPVAVVSGEKGKIALPVTTKPTS